ncbi:MAG TPA: 50S ribosomal protein L30 [Thermoanaerobaculaceae bacterium]|nr:50S ribosomal protein L30 [Thermoanaerobaculaceae bacterium]
MTTHRKTDVPRLRITQVHSIIGNQERVKRVVTDGLGLGRIGSSVVLVDNSYTRGMIAKAAHIVTFEEVAAEAHVRRPEPAQPAVPEAVEKLVEAAVAPIEKAPHRKHAAGAEVAEAPAVATEVRPAPKAEHKTKAEHEAKPEHEAKAEHKAKSEHKAKVEHKPKAEAKAKAGTKTAAHPARKRTGAKGKE